MVDWYGTPFTGALHIVERYRLLGYEATRVAIARDAEENFQQSNPDNGPRADPDYKGNGLQIDVTIEDRGAFTTPWSATVTLRKAIDQWLEVFCAENNTQWHPATYSRVPTAPLPDF